jgi:hypothetical protein
MWNTHTKAIAQNKWQMVRQHKAHIAYAVLAGLAGILPQVLYWKATTGSFMFDVGSKWVFLNPNFRVLFGWEKGWFVYTPVTVFFILGMFFIKQFPFRKSVLWFCLLNIYIIIAWHDWRYGGSYSARALVQGYAVFALPLAAFTEAVMTRKWKYVFYALCAYLLVVNLFQIVQYNSTVLHYNDMNRKYYSRIYLNPNPSAIDMSLLDNDEVIQDESKYNATILVQRDTAMLLSFSANESGIITRLFMPNSKKNDAWVKIDSRISAPGCLWQSYLYTEVRVGDSVKQARVRLFSPISKDDNTNSYTCYMSIPAFFAYGELKVFISSPSEFKGVVEKMTITQFADK